MIEAISNLAKTAASAASTVNPAMQQLELFKAAFNLISAAFNMATKNATSQLSSEAGMPKFIRDEVNKAVDQALSGKSKETSNAATEQLGGDKATKTMSEKMSQQIVKDTVKARQDEIDEGGSGGKGSWLRALAKVLGKLADKLAKELEDKGKEMQQGEPSKIQEYQAIAQEFSMVMNMITNAIKSIGEGNANAARKG
jgi:hypothetical protein